MLPFFSLKVPPPANWQDFEILCCDLWRSIWKDPNTQRNGRLGQPQHGVDIYGRPDEKNAWAGVQCKGKNVYAPACLREKELHAEVEKARLFRPALSQFIIASTGPKDANIEEVARGITDEHMKKGIFSVHVWCWTDIVARLADFPFLMEKYYPGLGLTVKELKRESEPLKMAAPVNGTEADFLSRGNYSLYIDLRSLEDYTQKIAEEKGITEKMVRESLINTIKEKIKKIKVRIAVFQALVEV